MFVSVAVLTRIQNKVAVADIILWKPSVFPGQVGHMVHDTGKNMWEEGFLELSRRHI